MMKAVVIKAYGIGSIVGIVCGLSLSRGAEQLAIVTQKLYAGSPNWEASASAAAVSALLFSAATWVGLRKRNNIIAQLKD